MPLRITEREVAGTTVLDIAGDMHGGDENMALLDRLVALGEAGRLDVVLNLAKVNFIASNGLGILMRARARYARFGGVMKICGANRRILDIFTITRLNLVFDVYEKCEDALRAVDA